jgi:hypothetical protein
MTIQKSNDVPDTTGVPLAAVGADRGAPQLLSLSGRYDSGAVPEIERFLRRKYGPFFFRQHLVLDLAQVSAVNQDFIDFIVDLAHLVQREHRELLLTRPAGSVRTVVCSVGLPNLVPVYDSLDEALEALAAASGALIPPRFDPRPLRAPSAASAAV